MSFLVANVPPVKVWVKKQYLYDLEKGHGEYVEGIWATVKSIQGRALYFETYIPEYAALYDKLPISAFVNSPKVKDDLPLEELELWDAFSYHITVIENNSATPGQNIYHLQRNGIKANIFTIDSCHVDHNFPILIILKFHKNINLLTSLN